MKVFRQLSLSRSSVSTAFDAIMRRVRMPNLRNMVAVASFLAAITAADALGQSAPPNPLRDQPRVAPATQAATQPAVASKSATPEAQAPDREIKPVEPLKFPARYASFLGPDDDSSHEQVAERVDYGRSILMNQEGGQPNAQPAPQAQPMEIAPEAIPQGGIEYATDQEWGDGNCCGGQGCFRCLFPCPRLNFDNFQFITGVQGFTGPFNRGESGSFGFHQAINWSVPLPCSTRGLGLQVGYRAVQSNLSGAEFTDDTRTQSFVTGGIFRRVDWGVQGGLVVDYRYDDWYAQPDLTQVRGEVSWVYPCDHELGFWFSASTKTSTQQSSLLDENDTPFTTTETWRVTDLFAFFYRRRLNDCGAEARFFAGFTEDRDGLIGGESFLPVNDFLALQSNFTFLIPEQKRGTGAHSQEGWNVGISLVWFPGCRSSTSKDYYRPLFRVADNGSFMIDTQ